MTKLDISDCIPGRMTRRFRDSPELTNARSSPCARAMTITNTDTTMLNVIAVTTVAPQRALRYRTLYCRGIITTYSKCLMASLMLIPEACIAG